jgi:hypothetical protein
MAKKIVFGEVDWNTAQATNKPTNNNDLFLRLTEGENIVRVLGNPHQFYVHWVETSQGKRKINSPIESPALVSRLEDSGFRRQTKWMIKVLDLSSQTFKVAEIGSQIYNGIIALVNNPRWGKVSAYDISIIRGPKGTNPLYSVTPNPKEGIDPSLKEKFKEWNAELDIERLVSPADPTKVCEVMGWDAASYTGDAPKEETVKDEDFDFDFE